MPINFLPWREAKRTKRKYLIFLLAIFFVLGFILFKVFYLTLVHENKRIKLQYQSLLKEKSKAKSLKKKVIKKTDNENEMLMLRLQYDDASALVKLLNNQKSHLLSKTGYAFSDKRVNALWVYDKKDYLNNVHRLVKSLDVPAHQVLIQAYIVNADKSFIRELGGLVKTRENQGSKKISIKEHSLRFLLGTLGTGVPIDLELSALEEQGKGEILSSPKLITSSGKTAYIGSGEELPYQEKSAQGNTSVAFKKAVLSLEVTPRLILNKEMSLDIKVHQDKVSSLEVKGVPAIHTQEVRTTVHVKDGHTLVLGGIFEKVNNDQMSKVPGLGNLPIVGHLFRHQQHKQEHRELLVFITPNIVD